MILLLSVVGAVALAWMVLASSDVMHLAALAIYTVTVVLPLIYLASRA